MCATHAMPDPDDGPWHVLALHVDQMEEIAGVIPPAGCFVLDLVWAVYPAISEDVRSFPSLSSFTTLLRP